MEDDHLLELVMWCHRQLTWLNSQSSNHTNAQNQGETLVKCQSGSLIDLRRILEQTAEAEMENKVYELQFSAAVCGVTIFRHHFLEWLT